MKTRVGIIGLGYWGPNLVRSFFKLDTCEIVYCCDKDVSRLTQIQKQFPSLNVTNNIKKVLQDATVEAVVIATPSHTHFSLVEEALKAQKHVLVEKPFTLSVKDAEKLLALSKKVKRNIMVGHTYEYNPAILEIKKYLEKKKLGKILYVYGSRVNLGQLRTDTNALWNLAPHDISILRFILGKDPIKVSAFGGSYLQKKQEDVVFLNLEFPKRLIAQIHVSWLDPLKKRTMTVVGDKKMLVFDDMDNEAPLKLYDKGFTKKYADSTFGEFHLVPRFGEIVFPYISRKAPLEEECAHFIESIQRNEQPRSNGESGLGVVKILEAAQESLDKGGIWVTI